MEYGNNMGGHRAKRTLHLRHARRATELDGRYGLDTYAGQGGLGTIPVTTVQGFPVRLGEGVQAGAEPPIEA